MSEAAEPSEDAGVIDVVAVERLVRPLRRALARDGVARVAASADVGRSLARVARRLVEPRFPEAVDALRAAIVEAFDGIESVSDDERRTRAASAWAALRQLDAILGLPLDDTRRWRPRLRRVPPQEPLPAADEVEEAEVETAAADDAPDAADEGASTDDASDDEAPRPRARRPRKASPPARPRPAPRLAVTGWGTPIGADPAGRSALQLLVDTPVADVESLGAVQGAGRDVEPGRVALSGRVRRRVTRLTPGEGGRSEVRLQGAGWVTVTWDGVFSAADLASLPFGEKVLVAATAGEDGTFTHGAIAREGGDGAVRTEGPDGVLLDQLHGVVDDLADPLPEAVRSTAGVPTLSDAVRALHDGDARTATSRLAFDEALAVQLGLGVARFEGGGGRGMTHAIVHGHDADLATRDLAPTLDDAQQAALEDVKRDLRGSRPMQRVLVGDDGERVDEVALRAILTVAESRNQVLVVVPDAPAATVLFDRWEALLRGFGLVPAMLAGEPRRAERDALRRGEMHVVIATPSVWTHNVEWRRLGLVVAFEQAVYGEAGVRVGGIRSPRPDLLVVLRTPVPRSIWVGAYPNEDTSVVPGGRGHAPGTLWAEGDREAAYAALGEAVRDGAQGLVAFPMRRDGADLLGLEEAQRLAATIQQQVLGDDLTVGVFHGAQTARDRQRMFLDMQERRLGVLVATVPVEWMPPLPRRTHALVEHADRIDPQRLLGLAALVGPTGHLHAVVGHEPFEAGRAFAEALLGGQDASTAVGAAEHGFEVHEACGAPLDVAPRWLADTDLPTWFAARAAAHGILRKDPQLRDGAHAGLLAAAHPTWARLAPETPCPLPQPRAQGAKKAASAPGAPQGSGGGGNRRRRRRRRRR